MRQTTLWKTTKDMEFHSKLIELPSGSGNYPLLNEDLVFEDGMAWRVDSLAIVRKDEQF